ncbi:MAG: hypothetical protein M1838_003507 [Thelocarpon superellum]|nr:MAG: hypothetical protein M1838_003507 [Thelocarpon superellum]
MANPAVVWPPRSPHEAMISSPSGRKRLRHMQDRTSPTPSPSKISGMTPSERFRHRQGRPNTKGGVGDHDEDEDEDEETLQLQLQAIEAKLKLKKLRQAKARGGVPSSDVENAGRRAESTVPPASTRRHLRSRDGQLQRAQSQPDIHVPLSPPQRKGTADSPSSPGRVLLGIDKGRTGRDVSLRKAPSLRTSESTPGGLSQAALPSRQQGNVRTPRPLYAPTDDKPKTFSERMAETRANDKRRMEQEGRIKKTRSKGFGIDRQEVERFKDEAGRSTDGDPFLDEAQNSHAREFSREEVLRSFHGPARDARSGIMVAPESRAPLRNGSTSTIPSSSTTPSISSRSSSSTVIHRPPSAPPVSSIRLESSADMSKRPAEFESFSGLHLSKRVLPHTFLTRTLTEKTVLLLPDLLKHVKAPLFSLPDSISDYVVLAVIASKSSPKSHRDDRRTATDGEGEQGRGKYMVFTLTDLKWELDLFIFGTGFDRFWKLTPGTVIALLNPNIMPPPAHRKDTGKFSLTLTSSDDTVLEIGTARDLGFCASIKKDGKTCDAWVDKRHTEHCAFHVDTAVRKTKASRMEVNTMSAPFGPGGRAGSRTGTSSSTQARRGPTKQSDGSIRDRATQSRVFITPSVPGGYQGNDGSAARLLDDVDIDPDAFHRGTSKEERLRRRLAERERERDIARRLGETGHGAGSTYLGAPFAGGSSTNPSSTSGTDQAPNPLILSPSKHNAASVRLSPIRSSRKRRREGARDDDEAVGWGGAFRRGLPNQRHASASSTLTDTSKARAK